MTAQDERAELRMRLQVYVTPEELCEPREHDNIWVAVCEEDSSISTIAARDEVRAAIEASGVFRAEPYAPELPDLSVRLTAPMGAVGAWSCVGALVGVLLAAGIRAVTIDSLPDFAPLTALKGGA